MLTKELGRGLRWMEEIREVISGQRTFTETGGWQGMQIEIWDRDTDVGVMHIHIYLLYKY